MFGRKWSNMKCRINTGNPSTKHIKISNMKGETSMKKTITKIMAVIIMFAVIFTMAVPTQVEAAKAKPKLNKKTVTLTITDKKTAPAVTLKIKNASKAAVNKAVWNSSNKKVAIVKSGKVIAHKKGKATITVKVNGKKLTCKVTVKDKRTPVQPTETPETPQKCKHEWKKHWTTFVTEGEGYEAETEPAAFCNCGPFATKEEFKMHLSLLGLRHLDLTKEEQICGIHSEKAKTTVTNRAEGTSRIPVTHWYFKVETKYIDYMDCVKCGKHVENSY